MTRVVAASVGLLVASWPGAALALAVLPTARFIARRRRRNAPDPVTVAARLLVLVGAGGALLPMLEIAARDTGAEADVDRVVRRARRVGTAAALATDDGPLEPLLTLLAHPIVSGAAVEPSIKAFLATERRRRHTLALERARRLPIRLMIPMTLLVLPGFVLMVYGPEMIGVLMDLLGPLGM